MVNVGTEVSVVGAPGYADFGGKVVAAPERPDGTILYVIMDKSGEIFPIESQYVMVSA